MASKCTADQTQNGNGGAVDGYWTESTQPLVCLVFVIPLLMTYELALVALGPAAVRNGAEVWLRTLLDHIGFSQYLLLPALTCFALLGMHYVSRHPWRLRISYLFLMWAECILFALVLLTLARWQAYALAEWLPAPAAMESGNDGGWPRLAGFLGAGLYEELLFRLMLLPGLVSMAKLAGASNSVSMAVGVIGGSILFSLAHYQIVTSGGEPFDWGTFLFRFVAGVCFSVLYLYRGFGVAAGTHALYDVLVVSI